MLGRFSNKHLDLFHLPAWLYVTFSTQHHFQVKVPPSSPPIVIMQLLPVTLLVLLVTHSKVHHSISSTDNANCKGSDDRSAVWWLKHSLCTYNKIDMESKKNIELERRYSFSIKGCGLLPSCLFMQQIIRTSPLQLQPKTIAQHSFLDNSCVQ